MTTKKTANTAKTVEDTVTETVEAAVTMTKEKVEEMQDQYTKAYEDFAVLGQASVDVMVKATSIFNKGAEDITNA